MKRILVLLTAFFCLSGIAQERQVSALFTHSNFNIPGDTPYVETYLLFDAWTLEFVPVDGKYQATLEITIVARQGDSIYYAKKYTLNSPTIAKNTDDQFQFLDLQRFSLPNGAYMLEVTVNDKNTTAPPQSITDMVNVSFPSNTPSISSIQLMSESKPTQKENMLSRDGFDMVPFTSSFVPATMKELNYYFEIYNINKEANTEFFATHSYLETLETGRKVEGTDRYTRHNAEELVTEYSTMDIRKLPSGNYNLVVEVVNKNNDLLLFYKYPFQRSNPIADNDVSNFSTEFNDSCFAAKITDDKQLTYYVKGLWPIANTEERNFITHSSNLPVEEKQHFMFMFWLKRDAQNPDQAWEEYRQKLVLVQQEYGYGKTPGYATDRGRV